VCLLRHRAVGCRERERESSRDDLGTDSKGGSDLIGIRACLRCPNSPLPTPRMEMSFRAPTFQTVPRMDKSRRREID